MRFGGSRTGAGRPAALPTVHREMQLVGFGSWPGLALMVMTRIVMLVCFCCIPFWA